MRSIVCRGANHTEISGGVRRATASDGTSGITRTSSIRPSGQLVERLPKVALAYQRQNSRDAGLTCVIVVEFVVRTKLRAYNKLRASRHATSARPPCWYWLLLISKMKCGVAPVASRVKSPARL